MIGNDEELEVTTLKRIRHFQVQLAHLRKTETNPTNHRLPSSGFMAEMPLEVRDHLSQPAAEAGPAS